MKVKKVGIVSLSSGILGEDFIEHEIAIALQRLHNFGVEVEFLPNSRNGMVYLQEHPKARADDFLQAMAEDSIDMILCAIGGDDTYRLAPYLFDHDELANVVNQKIFLGFSDTTANHFMLHKLGIKTFYGQALLPDIAELSDEMLPYTEKYFEELINTGRIAEITPSDVWYKNREDFSENGMGVSMPSFSNQGFELLQGPSKFEGEILGGCLESIYQFFDNSRHLDSVEIADKYQLFPSLEEWEGKILLLETSEKKSAPNLFRKMIQVLTDYGIFNVISGVLIGKPQDEIYYDEYKEIIIEEVKNDDLSILYNLNVGHATPRCIVPFGVHAVVDANEQKIRFEE
ncbi:LD-carboxypeptidase [Globicatella sulfidifaciens]|uniref:S66 family peptidase n=1 Tax=Globicatella sulfidifaciens TaxID=136093 RepID=UPI002890054E|nr:LD-carboxypeptidase [Globicatella sulfidifaciens]MDT2768186.1 LD-carboxypeptidase [Globicatella sulfidifaciens]